MGPIKNESDLRRNLWDQAAGPAGQPSEEKRLIAGLWSELRNYGCAKSTNHPHQAPAVWSRFQVFKWRLSWLSEGTALSPRLMVSRSLTH